MVDMITLPWLLLGLFIFLAFTTEAATGFGSIVIALSLGALVLPITEILPVLVPLNIVMSSTLSWRHRHAIHWPTLWQLILPLMVIGTLAGYGLRPWLGDQVLKHAFGVLVLWFSGRELWRMWRGAMATVHGGLWARVWMLMAGITHGLFASGGPLLVYALSGLSLDKQRSAHCHAGTGGGGGHGAGGSAAPPGRRAAVSPGRVCGAGGDRRDPRLAGVSSARWLGRVWQVPRKSAFLRSPCRSTS